MQTIPSFTYLVPVILLFGIGNVPGVIVTAFFATPPLVRLTNLGLREVRADLVEAADAFGVSRRSSGSGRSSCRWRARPSWSGSTRR